MPGGGRFSKACPFESGHQAPKCENLDNLGTSKNIADTLRESLRLKYLYILIPARGAGPKDVLLHLYGMSPHPIAAVCMSKGKWLIYLQNPV